MKNWRIYFVFLFILMAGLGITVRIFYIQVVRSGYYGALARGQQVDFIDFSPPRGNIFLQDKFDEEDGLFLAATNKDWPMLYAVPKEIDDPATAAAEIASILYGGINEKEADLYQRINDKDDPYEPIARMLGKDVMDKIGELGLNGIYAEKERLRYYPAGDIASHVLGFVGFRGEERAGQYGVEGFYDEMLRGNKGIAEVPFLSSARKEFFVPGKDLILSIDYNIQFMLERILREAKSNLAAEGASAIVMNPKNGEIMALAVMDSFDSNKYSEVENINIFLNDIVQKTFEPGSVFKPFTAAIALNEDAITPASEYKDEGFRIFGRYTIRNSNNEKHGIQNMTNVLEISINTGAVFMEESVGHGTFKDYMTDFGFDGLTGVDLQGEVLGNFDNIFNTSRDINFATASFGQGIAATPIQLIAAFSSFANGGKMVKPHVVKEIIESDGSYKQVATEISGVPISSKTAAQITAMLVSVVENGYSKKAGVKGYKVAGKTGTAQVPKKEGRGYEEDKTIHSFIGYAPAYDPRFIALIKVDNPRGINFSADSVAPLFSKIAKYILNYYQVLPSE